MRTTRGETAPGAAHLGRLRLVNALVELTFNKSIVCVQNLEAQRRHATTGEPVLAQLIEDAPAAELPNGDGDIATTGEVACCSAELH